VGSSSGAWIRSLPQRRHNPAATMPELPQPTDAQLDAAASQLEDGASQSGKQPSGDAGSGSVKLDSSDPGSARGSSGGSPSSSGGDISSDPAPDSADGDAQQPVKADDAAAQVGDLHASVPALAPAPDVKAAAAKEASSDERLQAADSPAEQDGDAAQSDGSGPAPQADEGKQAADGKDSGLAAPDSSDGGDTEAEGSGDSNGKIGAAPEQTAPTDSNDEAALSSAASPADSSPSAAAGRRSEDSQDVDEGSLSRASAPDEAALLADPIAKVRPINM
jgi:hypothetical protein